jgi:hypothetical protein
MSRLAIDFKAMTANKISSPPVRRLPEDWEHFELYKNVRSALATLPAYFRTETRISGINVTDLQTLNTVLGATIEEQVVSALNAVRHVWDPEESYALYHFVRQAQTFPDVLLKRAADGHILMGIELKGWYVLAKEGEPSFRYRVTPAACAEADLVVVVPWVLAQVLSGSPIVFDPYVESARFAAEYRNYHWQYLKQHARVDPAIKSPKNVHPYPAKRDQVGDVSVGDQSNFGRFSRTGIMDDYLKEMKSRMLCGVRIEHWLLFLKTFQETRTDTEIRTRLGDLRNRIEQENRTIDSAHPVLEILNQLERLVGLS